MESTYSEYIKIIQQWNTIMLFCLLLAMPIMWFLKSHFDFGCESLPANNKFWLFAVGLALCLRLPLMFANPWYDETYTRAMALVQWADFAPALLSDVHPPMFYMIERFMAVFSDSPFMLRVPSLIAGIAILPVIYRLTVKLSGFYHDAKIAVILVAVLPMLIRYSTEARYPMLLALVVLLAVLAIIENQPIRFIALAMLPVYLHTIGFLYAAMLGLVAIGYHRSKVWFICTGIAGILAALWLPGLYIQSEIVTNGFWIVLEYPITFVIDMTTGRIAPNFALMLLTFIVIYCLSLWALWYHWIRRNDAVLWLMLALLVPLSAWIISLFTSPVYLPRSLIASVLLFMPIWADMLGRSKAFSILCSVVILVSLPGLYSTNRAPITNVIYNCTGSSNVYTVSNATSILALYYVPGAQVYIWDKDIDLTTELTPDIQRAFGLEVASNPDGLKNLCIIGSIQPHTSQIELDAINAFMQLKGANVVSWSHNSELYHYVSIRTAQ